MKLFECQACGQLLGFENTECVRCGRLLGFLSASTTLSALEPLGAPVWKPLARPDERYRFCANDQHRVCNWLVPADSPDAFCPACRLNRTIPNLDRPEHIRAWQQLEWGKHRLIYGLLRLGLPLTARAEQSDVGLAFDFLAPWDAPEADAVTIGHARGLITMNIAEADPAERERFRANLNEPYRTILGHFRHEVGHYYWERLIADTPAMEGFRQEFGDERRGYQDALQRHYLQGPLDGWEEFYVSAYASAHPWEDWAETWAHYLHMVDTLETAYAYRLSLAPPGAAQDVLSVQADFDPYVTRDFDAMLRAWFPLVHAGNSLNRSMGQPDLYPFVLTERALAKLRWVHDAIAHSRGA